MKGTIIYSTWLILNNIVPMHNKVRREVIVNSFTIVIFLVYTISLYDLCRKYGYHRDVIHNIFKNCFIDVNITSYLIDMFDSFI